MKLLLRRMLCLLVRTTRSIEPRVRAGASAFTHRRPTFPKKMQSGEHAVVDLLTLMISPPLLFPYFSPNPQNEVVRDAIAIR